MYRTKIRGGALEPRAAPNQFSQTIATSSELAVGDHDRQGCLHVVRDLELLAFNKFL